MLMRGGSCDAGRRSGTRPVPRMADRGRAGSLGDLVIVVKFGRKGAPGRTITNTTAGEAGARSLWRRSVARRAGAKRQIGVAYRVVESAGLKPWMTEISRPA